MSYDDFLNRGFDAGFEGENMAARCNHMTKVQRQDGSWFYAWCDERYEDHNDEELGHPFKMPEKDGRDY